MTRQASPSALRRAIRSALLSTAVAVPVITLADTVPLELLPTRLAGFETAQVLPEGTVTVSVGTSQAQSASGFSGTGSQIYFGGGSYAFSDRLLVGLEASSFQDPPLTPIAGGTGDEVGINTASLWAKYQIMARGGVAVSAMAAVDYTSKLQFPLTTGRQEEEFIPTVKLPVSYQMNDRLAFHLTPSATFYPETVGGQPFYGPLVTVGVGASFAANKRLDLYGTIETPVYGNNTLTSAGGYEGKPIWTVGGRYNLTPKIALEGFLTNGVGRTPGFSAMSIWPDGDAVSIGANLVWTPGITYPDSYRGRANPTSERELKLQQDGLSLGSAEVLDPGYGRAAGWYGANDQNGLMVSLSPDRDGEVQLIFEQYANDGTANAAIVPGVERRYMLGPKLRVLDQNNGDPVSLSGRLLFGRTVDTNAVGGGVFYGDALLGYEMGEQFSVTGTAKYAGWGTTDLYAAGVGVNYEVFRGIEAIGEVSVVGGTQGETIWSLGARYNVPNSGLSVDAQVTNAIGRYGIGTMIAQDDPQYSIGVSTAVDLSKLF